MTAASRRASGRFVLRIDPALHAALRRAAADEGVSLNRLCAARLAAPMDASALGLAPPVQRAQKLFGDHLLAVVALGSWARGEATTDSDLDVLVVLDQSVELSRALYGEWDRAPLTCEGRAVDTHFAHFPISDQGLIDTWAEVAIDGIVLFDRQWRLSRRLAAIRRSIAEGRLVRRFSHGQPYWAAVA